MCTRRVRLLFLKLEWVHNASRLPDLPTEGELGDGSTSETSTSKLPEDYASWVWSTFRPDGQKLLEAFCTYHKTSKAIEVLRNIKWFKGLSNEAAIQGPHLPDLPTETAKSPSTCLPKPPSRRPTSCCSVPIWLVLVKGSRHSFVFVYGHTLHQTNPARPDAHLKRTNSLEAASDNRATQI